MDPPIRDQAKAWVRPDSGGTDPAKRVMRDGWSDVVARSPQALAPLNAYS
jgi:hypothetical protein